MKKRTWIIGIVWGIFFIGWWIRGAIYRTWGFDIFSYKSWRYIGNEFEEGWVIQTASDWAFIITLILIIPLFLLGWWICHKIHWVKITKASKKIIYATRKRKATLSPQKNKNFKPKKDPRLMRPKHMGGMSGSIYSKKTKTTNSPPPVMPSSSLEHDEPPKSTTPPSNPTNPTEKKKPAFLEDDDELKSPPLIMTETEMATDEEEDKNVEDIGSIIQSTTYHIWTNVELQNVKLNFICVDSKKILIVFEDSEEGDWLADEEQFADDPPLWFSETSHRTSPIFSLNKIRKFLEEQISRKGLDYSVQICYCLGKVNVVNWEEMETIWKKLNVLITQNHVKETVQIPAFSEIFPQPMGTAPEQDIAILNEIF